MTYITGNYDKLIEPDVITPGWDYICFSDSPNVISSDDSVWEVYPLIEEHMKIQCSKRRGNAIVMEYYKYIPEDYETCLIVDGNIHIQRDLNEFLETFNYDNNIHDFMIAKHPDRNCIYEEGKPIIDLKKDGKLQVSKHLNELRKEKYPPKNGLYQTNVMIVNNKSEKTKKLFERWFSDYMALPSKRDQMTLNYSIWKLNNQEDIHPNILTHKNDESNKENKRFRSAFNNFFTMERHIKNQRPKASSQPQNHTRVATKKKQYTAKDFVSKRKKRANI